MPKGLYANIHAKRKRIQAGSKEKMRKPGSKGAPTAKAFRDSKKTKSLLSQQHHMTGIDVLVSTWMKVLATPTPVKPNLIAS